MKLLVGAIALMLAAFILWGIGAFVRRKAGAPTGIWPVTIAVGLAVVVFVGGLLNFAHIAYGPVLWGVVLVGMILSVLELKRVRLGRVADRFGCVEFMAAAVVIAVVTGFAIITQLPPSAFNCYDDFQKYFAYPVRMLATGTLLGSPLDGLGYQSLGGQPFLQGFVLSVLPIGYINGVDAVFGLFVLMLLAASAGHCRFKRFPGAIVGPVLIAAINPQYVNVTSLYLGGALMAAAVMLVADEREMTPPAPFAVGLLYAALVALKPTFALFGIFHLPLSALAIRIESSSWRKALAWAGRVGAWTAVGVAPWFATHLPNYLHQGIQWRVSTLQWRPDQPFDLLSPEKLYLGDCFLHYSAVVGLAVLVGICSVISVRSAEESNERRLAWGVFAAAGAAALSYLVLIGVMGKLVSGYETALRFSIPTILGCAVFVVLLFPKLSLRLSNGITFTLPILACIVVVLAAFGPSLVTRYRQALKSGNVLAFSGLAQIPEYLSYNQYCLSKAAADHVRNFQEKVPAGEPLFAWVNTPFLLDYKRNPILDAEGSGLLSPWAHIPSDVHYRLFQFRGYRNMGTRNLAYYEYRNSRNDCESRQDALLTLRSVEFLGRLNKLSAAARLIARDDELTLLRFPTMQ